MSVTGVGAAPPGAAALAGAAQQSGAAADPAQVREFDALMQPRAASADASPPAAATPAATRPRCR
ncbi:hypothetical protein FEP01_01402 [Burkholderia multivorans]|nr:hypothetical protein [Burkholderia multivorans]